MSLRRFPTLTPTLLSSNRSDARKSTCPRSARGKARSKPNHLGSGGRSPEYINFLGALLDAPHFFLLGDPNMNQQPRRGFLKQLGTLGAAVAFAPPALRGSQFGIAERALEIATAIIPLDCWWFSLDPEDRGERQEWFDRLHYGAAPKTQVAVPHTWQVSPDTAEYRALGGTGMNSMPPRNGPKEPCESSLKRCSTPRRFG